jgi:hypothetical protein
MSLSRKVVSMHYYHYQDNYYSTVNQRDVVVLYTPSVSNLEVVLDKVWIKYWEYKSSITFKLLSLQMYKSIHISLFHKYFL